jgi:hypothetical protein
MAAMADGPELPNDRARTSLIDNSQTQQHPNELFMMQVARNLTDVVDGFLLRAAESHPRSGHQVFHGLSKPASTRRHRNDTTASQIAEFERLRRALRSLHQGRGAQSHHFLRRGLATPCVCSIISARRSIRALGSVPLPLGDRTLELPDVLGGIGPLDALPPPGCFPLARKLSHEIVFVHCHPRYSQSPASPTSIRNERCHLSRFS